MMPTKVPRGARAKIPVLLDRLAERYGRVRHIPRFDPMEELVSCILSQHTADANSFPAFTRLKQEFPEWEMVDQAGAEGIVEQIRKAGLANQKSKSIVNCLRAIKERTGDYSLEVLRDMPTREARAWLESLPGVGPKTASIVLCFSFGRESIPVDTHVFRVSQRLGILPEATDEKKAHDQLLDLVDARDAFRFHALLIQHGRITCKAPIPVCGQCTVTDLCPWFKKVGPEKEKARRRAAR